MNKILTYLIACSVMLVATTAYALRPDGNAAVVPSHPIYPPWPGHVGPPHHGYGYYDYYGKPYVPRFQQPPRRGPYHYAPHPGYGNGRGPMYRYWYSPHGWGFSIGPHRRVPQGTLK